MPKKKRHSRLQRIKASIKNNIGSSDNVREIQERLGVTRKEAEALHCLAHKK